MAVRRRHLSPARFDTTSHDRATFIYTRCAGVCPAMISQLSEKALLVNQEGRLRGVYNATVPHDIDKLIADLDVLTSTR